MNLSDRVLKRNGKIPVLIFLVCGVASAQTHFMFTRNTGNNATIGIPLSANPCIDGVPLFVGDEIGAFTPDGLCVGAVVWDSTNTAMTVWGDNELTEAVDGLRSGEEITYRVWQKSTDIEYVDVAVTYSEGDGIYGPDKIFVLSALDAKASTSAVRKESTADETCLFQNRPNPFNPATKIVYRLSVGGAVSLRVYNSLGQEVRTLVDGAQNAGEHEVVFDAGDLSSGVYFYRLSTQSFSKVRKMILIK